MSTPGPNEPTVWTPTSYSQPSGPWPPEYPQQHTSPHTSPQTGYPQTGYPAPPVQRLAERSNLAGMILTAAGVVIVLLGVWLPWYAQGGSSVKLSDILAAARLPGAKGLPHAYFGFGLWVAIALTLALCLLGNMGFAASAMRIVGPLVAVLAAGLVLASLSSLRDGHGSIFDHASGGLWLVILGFLVAAAGGVLGAKPLPRTG